MLGMNAPNALADDRAFFQSVAGVWTGPGEIVAGKYKGTKFNCQLTGNPLQAASAGVTLDGSCRVGVFSQPMTAVIRQSASGYEGRFLDGAAGEGLDVVSGRVEPDRVIMGITRKALEGAMVARLTDDHAMNVTVSVKVGETMVPVIGMSLQRDLDSIAVGSIR
ncbi:hypothetical protein [Pararhizobium haloflavum]|uniref:hypothetical protein n=1 Tax=Pararhizobium haloflavum TaxID=2037914 RepID=UPI001FE139A7|nr:hypothetical protein [Pararhizobium haloflavum]